MKGPELLGNDWECKRCGRLWQHWLEPLKVSNPDIPPCEKCGCKDFVMGPDMLGIDWECRQCGRMWVDPDDTEGDTEEEMGDWDQLRT